MISKTRILAALLVPWTLFSTEIALAQLKGPTSVPDWVYTEEKISLARQRSVLIGQRDGLQAQIDAYDQKCDDIPSDSPIVDECRITRGTLRVEIQRYRNRLADYEQASEDARTRRQVAQAASIKGLTALDNGDYEAAVKFLARARDHAPEDKEIQASLEHARAALTQFQSRTGSR